MKFPAGLVVFLRTEERRTEFCLERPDNTDVVCAASNCRPEKPLQRYSKSI